MTHTRTPVQQLCFLALAALLAGCAGGSSVEVDPVDTPAQEDAVDVQGDLRFAKKDLEDSAEPDTPGVDSGDLIAADTFSELGTPCEDSEDCPAGFCIETSVGSICSVSCIEECPAGWACKGVDLFGGDLQFVCLPLYWHICDTCLVDADCQMTGAPCIEYGDEGRFCASECETDGECPEGFECVPQVGVSLCMPFSGSCVCRRSVFR